MALRDTEHRHLNDSVIIIPSVYTNRQTGLAYKQKDSNGYRHYVVHPDTLFCSTRM